MFQEFPLKEADFTRWEALVNNLAQGNSSNTQSSKHTTIKTPAATVAPSTSSNPRTTPAMADKIWLSIPWQGCTYIIRYSKTGEVLTLVDGQVVLEKPGGRGHVRWDCVDTGGWLGFKSPISGKYIGQHHDELVCAVDHHLWCEHFIARPSPEGGTFYL